MSVVLSIYSIAIDGVDLNDYGLWVVEHNAPYMPQPRVNIHELGGADGAVTQGSTFASMRVKLRCVFALDDVVSGEIGLDRDVVMTDLIDILADAAMNEKSLVLGFWPTKTWTARLVSSVDGELMQRGLQFPLEFIIPQPGAGFAPGSGS